MSAYTVLSQRRRFVFSSASRWRRVEALEWAEPAGDRGRPFLFFPSLQTYEEALAFAGLTDHEGPVFPIRVIGIEPEPRQS
jgi:hypothetical protein